MALEPDDSPYQNVCITPYGERGYLIHELGDLGRFAIERASALAPPAAFEECVLGADTVLLLFTRPVLCREVRAWLQLVERGVEASVGTRTVEVPVVYDGPDLADIAKKTGLSTEDVVALHSAPEYRVRMMGFTPGFPYLDGLDSRLHVARKASPRNRIDAGAVAIGGSHAGIYSVASPGGWHLLGRTDLRLFKPENARATDCDPSAIFSLAAGDTVKFIPI